ncbi:hypothetical protein F5884DRAFT_804590 [Xylogone sp. PMI_703]|nr:hypothetical protein F5884DRAFT_804590 [Xylogone sp. PMI_703]
MSALPQNPPKMENNLQDPLTVLTIGISGCSSSGKTTVAQLLSEVFSGINFSSPHPYKDHISSDLEKRTWEPRSNELDTKHANHHRSPVSEETNCSNIENGRTVEVLMIHQDSFFVSKSDCPDVTFKLTANDKAYQLLSENGRSLADSKSSSHNSSELQLYQYHQHETCGELQVRNGKGEAHRLHNPTENSYLQSILEQKQDSSNAQVLTEFSITGPNTDCISAIDMIRLNSTIKFALHTGSVPRSSTFPSPGIGTPTITWINALKNDYGSLIQKHRRQIENRITKLSSPVILPKALCFIEGFLLYSPDAEPPSERPPEGKIRAQYAAAREIFNMIDIKLFLDISRTKAKAQRFSRPEYRDPLAGGTRKPGQWWKTEGYFESVVWKEYLDNFNKLRRKRGIIWAYTPCSEGDNEDYVKNGEGDEENEGDTSMLQEQYRITIEHVVECAVEVILEYLERGSLWIGEDRERMKDVILSFKV